MKNRTRIFCLLLALVLLVSALPLSALATETEETKESLKGTVSIKVVVGKSTLYSYSIEVGDEPVNLTAPQYIKHKNKYYEFCYFTVSDKTADNPGSVTIPAFDSEDSATWQKNWGKTIKAVYKVHKHSLRFGYGRIYHWNICVCGYTSNEVRHVDPATDADKTCTCGYKFSDNADLTTLWLTNMLLSPSFKSDITEYTGQVRTYLDVTSTTITAKPFDALATVELPESFEIHEGVNKFVIHVTAEDKTTKKTYTVTAVKPIKVENTFISADGTTISTALWSTIRRQQATTAPSEAVMAKILELAATDKPASIGFQTDFSKWTTRHGDFVLPASFLKRVADTTEANLTFQASYGTTLTVPHSEIANLIQEHETITFRLIREKTFTILADGEEITVPETITLTLPQS